MFSRGSAVFHFNSIFTGLNNYRILLYSTSVVSKSGITNPLMAEFLVKSVGFSEQKAISIATKIKVSKSLEKCELVVGFLKESGFDGAQIRKVIAGHPTVLRSQVENTLKPKIRALEELGFSGSKLRLIISRNPDVLRRNLESSVYPIFRMLKSLLGNNELAMSVLLKQSRYWFSPQARKNMSANVLLMQSYGLTNERILKLMLRTNAVFMSHGWAEKILKQVEEKLGIPRTSNMFMYGIRALTMRSEENMESWLDSFRSYGWSEADISTLLSKNPDVLTLSKENVRAKLKYFMEDLGLGCDNLITNSVILNFSMEKRILPRVAVRQTLTDRNLLNRQIGIAACLFCTESKFMERFVLPYKEKLPQLYENYTQAKGHTV